MLFFVYNNKKLNSFFLYCFILISFLFLCILLIKNIYFISCLIKSKNTLKKFFFNSEKEKRKQTFS